MSKKIISVLLGAAVLVIAGSVFYFNREFSGTEPLIIAETPDQDPHFLKLSDNLNVSIFADGLKDSRVIEFDPNGRILISQPKEGKVVLVEDTDQDGKADRVIPVLEGLNKPHGLAFYDDGATTYLYVAETNEVGRWPYDSNRGMITSEKAKNIANLPSDGRHLTRTIAFGPNFRSAPIVGGIGGGKDKLYISVGSSCDVCVEDSWKRAAILESDPAGTYTAEFAGGLRNSVFFTFHPETGEMWATEMGRDNLGDNLPPDEINIIRAATSEHKFGARRYGWPFCYGDKVKDTKFNPGKFERLDIPTDCGQTESPTIKIPAHSAPLGLAFIPQDKGWPKEWAGDLLVAFHGSWNRSEPVGYEIVRFDLDSSGGVISEAPISFVSGWLAKDKIYGRPVDLKFAEDGSLFVSDDASGVIYKIMP